MKQHDCSECQGSGISYLDRRGNSDHMNAHVCERCSGTGEETSVGGPCRETKLIDGQWNQCARAAGHRGKHQAMDFVVTAEWAQTKKKKVSKSVA